MHIKKTKIHGLSPRANYTERATAACRRSDCQLLRIEDATWSAWWIPPAVYSRLNNAHSCLFLNTAFRRLYSVSVFNFFRLQLTQLGLIDRASLCPWKVVFYVKERTIMSRNVIVILIYHRHKPIDSINLLARSGDVMCFLWGTDKPTELSWVLNKRQDDG
jgi:hypothetical protein